MTRPLSILHPLLRYVLRSVVRGPWSVVLAFCVASALSLSAVTVSWNLSTDPNVTGYHLFCYSPTNVLFSAREFSLSPRAATNVVITNLPYGVWAFQIQCSGAKLIIDYPLSAAVLWTNAPPVVVTNGQWVPIYTNVEVVNLTWTGTNLLAATNNPALNFARFFRSSVTYTQAAIQTSVALLPPPSPVWTNLVVKSGAYFPATWFGSNQFVGYMSAPAPKNPTHYIVALTNPAPVTLTTIRKQSGSNWVAAVTNKSKAVPLPLLP